MFHTQYYQFRKNNETCLYTYELDLDDTKYINSSIWYVKNYLYFRHLLDNYYKLTFIVKHFSFYLNISSFSQ